MAQTQAVTVRKQVVVDAPIERAFTVFTDRFGDFKPPEHNLLGAPIAETVFEPRVGGSIVDRAADGSECRWARILAFDPPDRVVFSWDISPRWTIETDPAQTSEVEVRFYAESPTRTRVELEHRHIDRHGPGGKQLPTAWRAGGLAFVPGPVRRAGEGRPLTCRRSLPAPKSSARPPRSLPTPPTQPGSASGSRAWWTGTWTARPTAPNHRPWAQMRDDPAHRRRQPPVHFRACAYRPS